MTNLKETLEQLRKIRSEMGCADENVELCMMCAAYEKGEFRIGINNGVVTCGYCGARATKKLWQAGNFALRENNALPALEQAMAEIERLRGVLNRIANYSGNLNGAKYEANEALIETTE